MGQAEFDNGDLKKKHATGYMTKKVRKSMLNLDHMVLISGSQPMGRKVFFPNVRGAST